MKLVFCGTPEFAVPSLEAVLAAGHEVALVLTQPDRPAGRKMELQVPAVKLAALAHNLPVMQPDKIKNNLELKSRLEEIQPGRDCGGGLWADYPGMDARAAAAGVHQRARLAAAEVPGCRSHPVGYSQRRN